MSKGKDEGDKSEEKAQSKEERMGKEMAKMERRFLGLVQRKGFFMLVWDSSLNDKQMSRLCGGSTCVFVLFDAKRERVGKVS